MLPRVLPLDVWLGLGLMLAMLGFWTIMAVCGNTVTLGFSMARFVGKFPPLNNNHGSFLLDSASVSSELSSGLCEAFEVPEALNQAHGESY